MKVWYIAAIWCEDFFAAADIVAWSAWLIKPVRYVRASQENFDQMKTEQTPATRILPHPTFNCVTINHHIACRVPVADSIQFCLLLWMSKTKMCCCLVELFEW